MQTRQAGGRGEEDAGNIQAWIGVPVSPACPGTAGWQRAPGAEGWPELCYCWAAGTSVLPQLLGMELLPRSRRSPEGSQHFLAGSFAWILCPQLWLKTPPGRLGDLGDPNHNPQSSPNTPSIPCPPQTLCQPQTLCATGKLAQSLCYSFHPLSSGSPVCVWCLHPGIPGYCRPHSWCFPSPADIFLPMLLPWAGSGLAPAIPPMPDCPCEPSDGKGTAPSLGRETSHRMPAEGGMGMEGREIALIALGETGLSRAGAAHAAREGHILVFAFPTCSQKGGDLFPACSWLT